MKNAVIIAYGNIDKQEQEIFKRLIERNAHNMNFKSFKIIFVDEENLEKIVMQEIKKWEK